MPPISDPSAGLATGVITQQVTLHGLLTKVQSDALALTMDGLIVAVAAVYVVASVTLRRRGRRWRIGQTILFLSGLLAVFAALGSGLAAYDDGDIRAHVVQHVVLMMVAPPLLVLGRPLVLAAQAAPRPLQLQLVRLSGATTLRVLSGGAGWALFYGSMVLYFLTPIFALSVRDDTFHEATHAWFLVVGLCFWFGLVGEAAARRSAATRLAAVVAGMSVETALGLALLMWPRPLSPVDTLARTHTAGQILWISCMLVSGTASAGLLVEWAAADERAVRRLERRPAAEPQPATPAAPSVGARRPRLVIADRMPGSGRSRHRLARDHGATDRIRVGHKLERRARELGHPEAVVDAEHVAVVLGKVQRMAAEPPGGRQGSVTQCECDSAAPTEKHAGHPRGPHR